MDVAVVKATNHDVCSPKEKHVRSASLSVLPSARCAQAAAAACSLCLVYTLWSVHSGLRSTEAAAPP